MAKVLVTGGSGKLGRAVLKDLVTNGYSVLNVDQTLPRDPICPTVRIDLTDFGQVAQAVLGGVDERRGPFDAVVHLAAIPAPGLFANSRTVANNVPTTYNVFEACRLAGVRNVVFASSETVLGLPFETPPPYVPVDEEYFPRPETAYSLGKLLDETMAAQFCRWDPELKIVGLRFSNVMDVEDYKAFPAFDADPQPRWRAGGPPRHRGRVQGVRAFHHRQPGYGDEPLQHVADGRGLPAGAAQARAQPERHAAVDRQGAAAARLQPAA